MKRPTFYEYYLNIADAVAKRSTCMKRNYGAVIVSSKNEIISTGYNGAPRGCESCLDKFDICPRLSAPSNGGDYETCLSKDTYVKLLNGEYVKIKDLAKDPKYKNGFWVYACDPETRKIVPAKAYNARKTGYRKNLVRVHLDNGASFDCTMDHRIMLRDGSFTEAQNLQQGDSVMSMYYVFENADHEYVRNSINPSVEGSWAVRRNQKVGETRSTATHKIVYEYFNGKAPSGYDIHHIDMNSHNNEPDNLIAITHIDHLSLHGQTEERRAKAFGGPERKLAGALKHAHRIKTDMEYRKQFSERSRRTMTKLWQDDQWRANTAKSSAKSARKLAAKYNSDPDMILKKRRTSVAKGISLLMFKMFQARDNRKLTLDNYAEIRKEYETHEGKGKAQITKLSTILKYYDNFEDAIEDGRYYNHKVVDLEIIKYNGNVYDLEVPKYHNFAVSVDDHSCVFVHNCKSVHSEMNCIISAARKDMIGGTMFLFGRDYHTKEVLDTTCCEVCKRLIINAGIEKVVIAHPTEGYKVEEVSEWITQF